MTTTTSTATGFQMQSSYTYETVEQIAQSILERVKCRPKLGIICGSGLGSLSDLLENQEVIPYVEIPMFPQSTVSGHEGKLVFGTLHDKSVVLLKGRAHCYEGYSMQKITVPIRTMKLMGVNTLFITNAAGGVNPNYKAGDIMIIRDHFSLPSHCGCSPLVGPNDERFGPRFPAVNRAYDIGLRNEAQKRAEELGISSFLREGVYYMGVGPAYETVTDTRFKRLCGVDATGMSTVPEVETAAHCGMRVLALSIITDMATDEYDSTAVTTHEEVLEAARKRSKDMQNLISAMVKETDL